MPELVEVELSRQLAEALAGRTISSCDLVDPKVSRLAPQILTKALVGTAFHQPRRRGKLLLLDTDGPTLALHFGMSGRLVLDGRAALDRLLYAPSGLETRWLRLVLTLDDGGHLALFDPRRFARVTLDPDEDALGPDATSLRLSDLRSALGASRATLKTRLLDQRRIAGIGNLIGDEVLWCAGLAPGRPTGTLGEAELRRLHRQLKHTIRVLIARGGSHTGTLTPRRHPGSTCPKDASPLARDVVAGRTTYWCPTHQR
jgi:formamidopyrimidine-DNA glycosylase